MTTKFTSVQIPTALYEEIRAMAPDNGRDARVEAAILIRDGLRFRKLGPLRFPGLEVDPHLVINIRGANGVEDGDRRPFTVECPRCRAAPGYGCVLYKNDSSIALLTKGLHVQGHYFHKVRYNSASWYASNQHVLDDVIRKAAAPAVKQWFVPQYGRPLPQAPQPTEDL